MRSFVLLFCHSVIRSVSGITHERSHGRRTKHVGIGKRWLCRSGLILVLIRSRLRIYDYFSTPINITLIRLYTTYFYSTGGATALLTNYIGAASETMQEPWRSLSSLSTSCIALYCLFFYPEFLKNVYMFRFHELQDHHMCRWGR